MPVNAENIFWKSISFKPNALSLLEFLHCPNFKLSILFNNIFTLISEFFFWIEDSPALAMEALYSIINEIVVPVKKKKKAQVASLTSFMDLKFASSSLKF